jgi:LmbE family N-acetylglucosaminyl deacetylase
VRALFLGAHPDDVEVGAGGTIARLVDEGWEVNIEIPYPGKERANEAIAAANILGAGYNHFPQPGIWNHRNTITTLERRNIWLDLIVTPSPVDSHQEHRQIADLGLSLARKNNVDLWHMDSAIPGGLANNPRLNHYVKLEASHIARKEAAVRAHQSQVTKYGDWDWWWGTIFDRASYLGGMIEFGDFIYAEGYERIFSVQ